MVAPRGRPPVARLPRERSSGQRSVLKAHPKRPPRQLGQALVILVPLLLMLGSVYAHTTAARLRAEAAGLEEAKARVEATGERLEVRVTELSEPGRVRKLARDNLRMHEPSGKELEAYENDGEGVATDGEEEREETGG